MGTDGFTFSRTAVRTPDHAVDGCFHFGLLGGEQVGYCHISWSAEWDVQPSGDAFYVFVQDGRLSVVTVGACNMCLA